MRVLIFSWRGPGHPHAGGAEKSTHEHAKGWIKAGHEVTLFTSYYPGAQNEELIDGVRILRNGSHIFGVHLEAFKWFLFENRQKYDLVIDQFHGIPFFTPLYVRGKKLAFIHEVTKEVWGLNPWSWPFNLIPALVGRIFEPLIFMLLYRKIQFMTVSESTKADLVDWGIPEKNITVIHNGLEKCPLKKIPSKERGETLIFLGALAKDKGIEEALQTFAYINSKTKGYEFWVVGNGEMRYFHYLKLMAKSLSLDKKIKFWGYVSDNKKFELLGRAHILVNPSVREGWGLTILEAAAVGTPAVGFNVPGLRDSIINGKTGLLCDQDIVSCANATLSLMANQNKYQLMRRNCFEWAKKFSWQKSVRESLKLIENLV